MALNLLVYMPQGMILRSAMNYITYSTIEGNRDELYRTTPFEYDSSAAALAPHAVVTTTISEAAGNWVGDAGPIISPVETPESVPATDRIPTNG